MANQITEFVFPELGARGALVEFDEGLDAMLGARPYPADVRRLLGQAVAAMPLLASHARYEGRLSLQFQGKNALQLLIAQIDAGLQVRGMAKCSPDASGDFLSLMQGGTLGLLIEPERGSQNYQALVAIEGRALSDALEHYFTQSEQLPTLLRLAWSPQRLCGLLIQRLPLGENHSSEANWEHLQHLFATLGEAELAAVDRDTILHRLFHAEALRVLDSRPVQLACRCSREGIATMLLSLGERELDEHLAEHGQVEVGCEFCGRQYHFAAADIQQLFLSARMLPDSETRH